VTNKFISTEKTKIIYFLLIASLVPLIKPQFIYNLTLFDFINVVFIIFFLTYIFAKGELQIPLLIPMAVILIGSLISMFNAQVPVANSLALIIDLYLFIFFIVLYNVIETKRELKIFILFWIVFAALEGIFMLADIFPNFVKRSLGTFLNPNMGSSYLGLSFFLLFQPYARVGKKLTWLFGFFILSGMLATKSLAGIIGFFIGALAMIILYWLRTGAFNRAKLVAVLLIIAIIGLVIYPQFAKVPNLFSRFNRSSYTRIESWKTGLDTFIKSPLGYGIGPAGFKEVGPEVKGLRSKPKKHALHNDWLSFLVERGVIGFLGMVLLIGTITKMLFQTLRTESSKRESLWITALFGMLIFTLSFSFTHEVLHFRHVWCLFVLIAVEHKLRGKNQEEGQLAYER
jgi:O-antigen ligase